MKIEDIIALAGAGFLSIRRQRQMCIRDRGTVSTPSPAPAPAPIQTPTPASAPAPVSAPVPAQDVFNQRMGVLDNRLDEITKLIQVGNLSNSQIPEPPTTEDMLASIINPPVKE